MNMENQSSLLDQMSIEIRACGNYTVVDISQSISTADQLFEHIANNQENPMCVLIAVKNAQNASVFECSSSDNDLLICMKKELLLGYSEYFHPFKIFFKKMLNNDVEDCLVCLKTTMPSEKGIICGYCSAYVCMNCYNQLSTCPICKHETEHHDSDIEEDDEDEDKDKDDPMSIS